MKCSLWFMVLASACILGFDARGVFLRGKQKEAEDYVMRAARFFARQPTNSACADFANDRSWWFSSAKLFVIDERNLIWFLSNEPNNLWTTLQSLRTEHGVPLTREMQHRGKDGGWIAFIWNEDLVKAYVKNVRKGNHLFTIGAIFFAETPEEQVQEHVITAYNFIRSNGLRQAIEQINNPDGRFLHGSLSVSIYDSAGICLADSYDITRVGQGSAHWKDDNGALIFPQIKAAACQHGHTGWVEHTHVGLLERSFVRYVPDPTSKQFYILVSTYFPQVNEQFVLDFAQQAEEYIKREGARAAFADFIKYRNKFYKARLALVIYDDKGIVHAETRFPSVVGVDAYNRLDQAGYPITQIILKKARQEGQGWVFHYIANTGEPVYVKKLVVPEGTFVITVQGFTPMLKSHIAAGIAEWLSYRMLNEPVKNIFHALNKGESVWNRGFRGSQQGQIYSDFFIEIYDKKKYCVSAGSRHSKMWQEADKGLSNTIDTLRKTRKESGVFKDHHEGLRRFYYARDCVKSPTENYYIFVGYHLLPHNGRTDDV